MKDIKELENRLSDEAAALFLREHGCITWEDFQKKQDQDVAPLARFTHTFYHGYEYVWQDSEREIAVFSFNPSPNTDALETAKEIKSWCVNNCEGKWRCDWLNGNRTVDGNFELSTFFSRKVFFVAFKESKDFMLFKLVWE